MKQHDRHKGNRASERMTRLVWKVICREPHLTQEEIAYRLPKGRGDATPSKSTVNYAVHELARRGAIQFEPKIARSIVISAVIYNDKPYAAVWLDL